MRKIGFANWLALGAALALALSFFLLPLIQAPLVQNGQLVAEEIRSIPASDLAFGFMPDLGYSLPDLNWLGIAVIVGLVAAALSFLPSFTRSARYLALFLGLIAIVMLARVPLHYTGTELVALAQILGLGFWLGILASVMLVLQGFIAGQADSISENIGDTLKNVHINRKQILAAMLLLIGIAALWQALTVMASDVTTTLNFVPNYIGVPQGQNLPPLSLIVPTQSFLLTVGGYFIVVGLLTVFNPKQLNSLTTWLMVIGGILFFPMLLIWAAAGGSTNATTMLTESLRTATPIAIGAMAGIWCERTGVVNIAIEGMMLTGAALGFTALFFLRTWFPTVDFNILVTIAVLIAILSGGMVALLHAWLSITFAIDQIVSGTVINILALGTTSYIRREVLLSNLSGTNTLPTIEIPILSDLPVIGPIFSGQPIFYLMFVVIIATHIILFQTRWGLRMRAVGENPHAADTLGIKVNRTRWINVFIGGMIAGLGGAWFSLETAGRFIDGMTDGKGFIALAAMIFGKWTPAGSFGGAMLFGFSEALGYRFQILNVSLPPQFLQMVPYLVTLIVLAGLVGRAIPPKAVGTAYKKED